MNLLSFANAKTVKGEQHGYLTAIMHFAPGDISGYEVCGGRDECFDNCLYRAGRGRFVKVQEARIRRTKLFFEDRPWFMSQLAMEIGAAENYAKQQKLTLVVRPNGTSDIPWEVIRYGEYRCIMDAFPHIQFYDYTKLPKRRHLPANYHLTFSRGSDNDAACIRESHWMNIAVVFDDVPKTYMGKQVIDGDLHDLRFLDPQNVIVGLKAKGPAKTTTSTFILRDCNGHHHQHRHARATHSQGRPDRVSGRFHAQPVG